MSQRVSRFPRLDGPRNGAHVRRSNQVAIHEGVVNFAVRLGRAAQAKVHARTDLLLRNLERVSLVILTVVTIDELLDGRLQRRWIVDLKDQLPARRWDHRPVERHRDFATEWRGDVIEDIYSGLRLEFSEMLDKFGVAASGHLEDLFHDASRILDHCRRHHAGIGRNKFQRPHRSRCRQPGRDSLPFGSEGQISVTLALAGNVTVFHGQISDIPDSRWKIVMAAISLYVLGNDLFHIRREKPLDPLLIRTGDLLPELGSKEWVAGVLF